MDNYCEQIVTKKKTSAEVTKTTAAVLGSLLGVAACMFFSIYKGILFLSIFAAGFLWLGIWVISNMNIEYEYIVTNNEMDIDKIIGKRKRKRMITVDLSKSDDIGTYPPDSDVEADTTVHATSGLAKNAHYLLVKHKEYGKVKVIFNPNEKLREAIALEIPKSLSAKLNNNVK